MDEALDKAVRVFCERGFHATSITDLAEGMGLTVGSIYKAFNDKRAIFLAAIDRQMAQRSEELMSSIEVGKTGREKLRRALMAYAEVSNGAEGRRGCLVVGTLVDLSTFDPEISARVLSSLKNREKLLAGLIRVGQGDGSISGEIDVKATAHSMLCLLQGLRVVGKTSPTRSETTPVVDIALKMLV